MGWIFVYPRMQYIYSSNTGASLINQQSSFSYNSIVLRGFNLLLFEPAYMNWGYTMCIYVSQIINRFVRYILKDGAKLTMVSKKHIQAFKIVIG